MSLLLGAMETAKLVAIIIDVAVVAFLLIFLFVGMKKGMLKMGYSLIAGILTLVLAVITVSPITEMVKLRTNIDDNLNNSLETKLLDSLPSTSIAPIFYVEDEDYVPEEGAEEDEKAGLKLVFRTEEGIKDYEDIFKGSPVGMLNLQKLLKPAVEKALDKEAENAAEGVEVSVVMIDVVTDYISTGILLVILFIILCILYRIVFAVIGLLVQKAVKRLYVVHFLDKVLGAVFGLAAGAVVLLIIITVIQFIMPFPFMDTVTPYLQETKLLSFIMDHNVVYNFLMNAVESNETLSGLYAGLTGAGESEGEGIIEEALKATEVK